MLLLLSSSLVYALDGQSSLYLPSAEQLMGQYGRLTGGLMIDQNKTPVPFLNASIALPKGICDASYTHPVQAAISYRYPIAIKSIWSSAPFVQVQLEQQPSATIGLSNQLHIATIKTDLAVALASYNGSFEFPPETLKNIEFGIAFPPAPRQEIRIGYANISNHELNLRYQRAGQWTVQDIQVARGIDLWRVQASIGYRR